MGLSMDKKSVRRKKCPHCGHSAIVPRTDWDSTPRTYQVWSPHCPISFVLELRCTACRRFVARKERRNNKWSNWEWGETHE